MIGTIIQQICKKYVFYIVCLSHIYISGYQGEIIFWHKDCILNDCFTFVFNLNCGFMKKLAVILVISVITAVLLGSCNSKSCPAYSKTESAQTESNG